MFEYYLTGIDRLSGYLGEISSNIFVVRIIESVLILFIILIILLIIKNILRGISKTAGVSEASIENMYSLIKSATIIVTLFIILYILTQQQAIAYFILGVILILIAASWEVIANVASYYVILISRGLNKGDLVSIDDIVGKVREINPFFVVVEGEDGVYKIPNRVVLHKMVKMPVEPAIVTLNIRIWGLDDPEVARSIIQRIEDEIATLTRPLVTSPRHLQLESSVEELSSDSVTISIKLPVPGRKVSRRKFNRLLEDLAVSLKETGYSFTISLQT